MTISNGYASLNDFLAYVSTRGHTTASTTDTTDDDTAIEGIVEMASRYIDGMTGRHFYTTTDDETRYFTPDDSGWMFVDDLSAAPTTLKVDYSGNRSYNTAIASSDYDLLPANPALDSLPYTRLEIHYDSTDYFPSYRKGVQVVGKFGFPAVPVDIKQACLAIALNVYNARIGQSNAGNVSVTAAGVVIRPQDVPGWASQIFMKYRRYV